MVFPVPLVPAEPRALGVAVSLASLAETTDSYSLNTA